MGRIKKIYTEHKDWKIYAIVFPNSMDFFVGMTSQEGLRDTYKNHFILRNRFTKPHFEKFKAENLVPDMYLLEVFEGTKSKCFSRIVAWAKVLIDNGYTSVNGETFVSYTEDMLERTQEYYEEIKDTDISKLITAEKSLFPKYKTKKQTSKRQKICITLTPEEYDLVEQRAKQAGFRSLSAYCKQMALKGEIYVLADPIPSEYTKALRESIQAIKQSIVTIYALEQYFPYDLQRIQECADIVQDHYKLIVRERQKIYRYLNKKNQ